MTAQLPLLPEAWPVITHGCLRLMWREDGTLLLEVEQWRGGAWLALRPDDQAWLVGFIQEGQKTGAAPCDAAPEPVTVFAVTSSGVAP